MALSVVLRSGLGCFTFDVHSCVDILFSVLHLLLIIYSLFWKYSHCFTPAPSNFQAVCLVYVLRFASGCVRAADGWFACWPLWIFLYPQPSVSLECKIRRKFLLSNYLVTYDGPALLHKNASYCY